MNDSGAREGDVVRARADWIPGDELTGRLSFLPGDDGRVRPHVEPLLQTTDGWTRGLGTRPQVPVRADSVVLVQPSAATRGTRRKPTLDDLLARGRVVPDRAEPLTYERLAAFFDRIKKPLLEAGWTDGGGDGMQDGWSSSTIQILEPPPGLRAHGHAVTSLEITVSQDLGLSVIWYDPVSQENYGDGEGSHIFDDERNYAHLQLGDLDADSELPAVMDAYRRLDVLPGGTT